MKKLALILSAFVFAACTSSDAPAEIPVESSTHWSLASGIVDDVHTYEGYAELSGWMIMKSAYVGDPEPHFHVSNDGMSEMPEETDRRDYVLLKAGVEGEQSSRLSETELEDLMASSEAQPTTIEVAEIRYGIEGSPHMRLAEEST